MSLKEKAESKAKEYQVADVCRVWNNGCQNIYYASMEMFEWTKQELIDKACEYLRHYQEYPNHDISAEALIVGFRKYMEG